jgi:CspA family cold shock protein
MKWFDATRGFGFLVSEQAKGDVLVHFSVLKEHDRRSLPEGAVVECLVAEQERGLQARKVLSIDLSQAVVPESPRAGRRPASGRSPRCSTRPASSSRCGSNGSTASRATASWSATTTRRGHLRPHGDGAPRRPCRPRARQPLRARIADGRKGPLAVEVGDPPRPASFWMKNTLIPLDMIFVRPDGTIGRIAANTCRIRWSRWRSNEPVAAVLEIAGGRSAQLGIKEGDRVSWPGGPALVLRRLAQARPSALGAAMGFSARSSPGGTARRRHVALHLAQRPQGRHRFLRQRLL